VAAVTLAETPADATRPKAKPGLIVPQKSIDALTLGMTPEAVRARFGRPQRTERSSESETGHPIKSWLYTRRGIEAEFRRVKGQRLTLAGLSTTSSRLRTSGGARVGSSASALRARLSGLDCGDVQDQRWCTIGSGRLGSRQTIFVLRNGRVREIRILVAFP